MTTPEPRVWIDEACPQCKGEGYAPDNVVSIEPSFAMPNGHTACTRCQGGGFITRRITLTALAYLLTELKISLLTSAEETTQS